MPRPPIERAVGGVPRVTLFKPAGVPTRDLEQLPLAIDELEAIRLVDLEGLSHEQAAAAMGVSRQTVGRVLERGRAKVADALVGGKAILIGGGQYRVEPRQLCCFACRDAGLDRRSGCAGPATCPACGSTDVRICWGPGGPLRRLAAETGRGMRGGGPKVGPGRSTGRGRGRRRDGPSRSGGNARHPRRYPPTRNESRPRVMTDETNHPDAHRHSVRGARRPRGPRSGHFGRCECFTMVDVVDGEVGEVQVLTNAPHVEGGCMAPVLVLAEHNVDAIVVDGIGGRPLMGFNQVGIAVHAGVGDDVQTTVHAFIQGGLPVVGFDNACQH